MAKYLVVGAGLSGATIARELADAGHTVIVIDSRTHIAGNAYDETNEYGIRVHKYGPHLFHTNNEKVFEYLSRFTEWVEYDHRVKALLEDGRYVTFPPNKETKEIVGAENVVDTFYRPYTKKMWGKELEEVAPKILDRVPGRDDMEDRYFPNDKYCFMPVEGYTKMVENMLDHQNIRVRLAYPFKQHMEDSYDHVFNSMAIDEYYGYQFGELEYRSIKFHTTTAPIPKALPATTVNFTNDGPLTRVTEWKNLPCHGDNPYFTTLTAEEPCDYKDNNYERYYPISDDINKDRYAKYASIKNDKVTFIGRCGMYVYLNMDQVVNSSLSTIRKFLSKNL